MAKALLDIFCHSNLFRTTSTFFWVHDTAATANVA